MALSALAAGCASRAAPPIQAGSPSTPVAEAAGFAVGAYPVFRQRASAALDQPFGDADSWSLRATHDAPLQKVGSCRELVELPLGDEVTLEEEDELTYRTFWSVAVDCAARSWLRSAKPARHSRLSGLFSAKDPTLVLPPALGLGDFVGNMDEVKAAAARCQAWKAFDGTVALASRSDEGFSIRADIWQADVKFYARGDFDGDGYEDLMVRRDGTAAEGSYRASALFVLSKTDEDACIRVSRELGTS